MIVADDIVEIGRYNKAHGVKGEISATLSCEVDALSGFSTLISCMDGIYVPFFVGSYRKRNEHTALLTIDGVDSEEAAKRMVNKRIYALRSELPEDDGRNSGYFEGFAIDSPDGARIGVIVGVDDATANVLFEVEHDGKQFYIPVSEAYIVEIREEESLIVMDLPEGLVEMQTVSK